MTRSEDDRLDRPELSEVPVRPRRDPHPSDFLPGAIGRRLGLEGVPLRREDAPAKSVKPKPRP